MDKKTGDQCKKKLSYIKDAYKKSKDNNKKSGASLQFCSFYEELDKVLGTRDAITLPSTLETGSTNQNTSASTGFSSFVNFNKLNVCLDNKSPKEENNNKKTRKTLQKSENIDGLMEMNMCMLRESEERQHQFLENFFKQQQKADKLEQEKDREFLLKLGQMFKNDN